MTDRVPAGDSGPPPGEWKESWSLLAGPHNIYHRLKTAFVGHFWRTAFLVVALLVLLFVFREEPQPLFLKLRIYSGGLLVAALAAWIFWQGFKYFSSARARAFSGLLAASLVAAVLLGGRWLHDDIASFIRYETMRSEIVERDRPLTTVKGKERLIPLQAVQTRARDRMDQAEVPSPADLVRVGDKPYWTMSIEPKNIWGRFWDPITQVMSIPATDPSPDFGRDTVPTHFTIGENLLFGRNTDTCTRRSFGPWKMLNYEPSNVLRMPDASGKKMVTVVSLIKWTGWNIFGWFFFPWPEFGGVQVIEEGDTNFFGRIINGCGYWVPPQDIAKHPFLVGQNLIPYEVSRTRAASLRFQRGSNMLARYLAPRWWTKQGAIVIADIPQDMNPLPFALYFQTSESDPGKLYQYFCMETTDETTHGLSVSFWYPGDGIGPSYVVRHAERGERLLGCTGVKDKVLADRPEFKGDVNSVAEARPYIHRIADANGVVSERFFYMTTLVVFSQKKASEGGEARFTTSGRLYLALTDARREIVTWVDPEHPDTWDDELQKKLGKGWAGK